MAPHDESTDPKPAVNRRVFLTRAGGASAALIAAGYGASAAGAAPAALSRFRAVADASSAARPVRGGTLTMSQLADNANSIDPNQIIWAESRSYARNIADCLTDQDPKTGAAVPWLATSWTVNKNATSFGFKLRKGVTFSNGEKFNAQAVKTAFEGIVALGPLAQLASTYLAGFKNVKVRGEYEVEINFVSPNSQFMQATSETALAILSPSSYKLSPQDRAAGKFFASGLFTVQSYVPGQTLELVRRKGYKWPSSLVQNKGEAYLDGITASWQLQDSVRLGDLDSGQLDIDWPHTPMTVAYQQQIKSAGDQIYWQDLPGVCDILLPNVSAGKVFSDIRVRQAFQKSINRAAYASTIFWSDYPVIAGVLDRATPGWTDLSKYLKYDLAGAKQLLSQAGWTAGSDGYLTKGGQELTVTYLTAAPSAGTELIQAQAKAAGFNVVIKVDTAGETATDEAAGNYDVLEISLDRADPHALAAWFSTKLVPKAPVTFTQSSAEAAHTNALFTKGLATVAPAANRYAIYNEIQEYLIKNGNVFPIYERRQYAGVSKNVHGFAFTSEAFLRANDIWKSA